MVLLVFSLAASNATVNCVFGKPLFPDFAFTSSGLTNGMTGAGKVIGVSSVGFLRVFPSANAPAISIYYSGVYGPGLETLLGNSSGIHYSLIPGTTVVFGGHPISGRFFEICFFCHFENNCPVFSNLWAPIR